MKEYNSGLLKATGLIQETLILADMYEEGMSKATLLQRVIEQDALSKATNSRVKDIIERAFFIRYINVNPKIMGVVKVLRRNYVGLDVLSQILLIYTARTNLILGDFIKSVYFPMYRNGNSIITKERFEDFIKEAIKNGRIVKKWSDITQVKVIRHLGATLADFRLVDKTRHILPFPIFDLTANFLVHELHFSGHTEQQIINAEDWQLFGLTPPQVQKLLEQLAYQGHFIYQNSGEIVRIAWKYTDLIDFAHGASQ